MGGNGEVRVGDGTGSRRWVLKSQQEHQIVAMEEEDEETRHI
jgi:hypothetical protein